MTAVQLVSLTSNGEEAVRKYIDEVEDYARRHPIKVRIVERAKSKLVREEYFENPLRIVVTILKEDMNLALYVEKIHNKLNGLMKKYGAGLEDYNIEVL